jgi:hypothetical protein
VQAWIIERQQMFDLDAATMITLADAGVPATVTDAMVAVSNPQYFRFDWRASDPELSRGSVEAPVDRGGMAPRYVPSGYRYDRRGSDYYGYDYYGYEYYGFYGYGSGYGPYYSPYGGGVGYYTPVVVTRQPELPHGRVVKGRGYTADFEPPSGASTGSSSSGSSATTRAAASSSSRGGSSGSSSGSNGSSGSSTGRTAQKKGGGQD